MNFLPHLVSTHQIQRNYRAIFNRAKLEPVVVLTNNQPDVAIVNVEHLQELYEKAQQVELAQALKAVSEYQRAKKAGQLHELRSLEDLIK